MSRARGEHEHREAHAVLRSLKERGYRMTEARTRIVEEMRHGRKPKSIRELARRVTVDETSVYRTVSLLLKEDLAEAIPLSDESFVYALKTTHHHHLVCVSCHRVTHIACADDMRRPRHSEFSTVLGHEVTFYGLCRACA